MFRTIENKEKNINNSKNTNKTTIKSALLVLILATVLVLSSGCTSINYLEQSRNDGSYFVALNIGLNSKEINGNILEETMKNQIQLLLTNIYQEANMKYVSNLENAVHNGEITIQNYVDLLQSFECKTEFQVLQENYFTIYILIIPTQSEDKSFSVADIFNLYSHGTLNPNKENNAEENLPEIREHFLTLVLEQGITSPYSNDTIKDYANIFLNELNYSQDGYTLNDVDFSYTYCTDYRRVHSNSDDIDYANGTYFHTWTFEQDENGLPIAKEMTIYRNYLNTVNWYLIGLVLAVLIVGGVTLTLFIIHKNKQKKEKEKLLLQMNINPN